MPMKSRLTSRIESLAVLCALALVGAANNTARAADHQPAPNHKGSTIRVLQERLTRQEALLADQQQRIARLESEVDRLIKQPARPLLASSEPATLRKVAHAPQPGGEISVLAPGVAAAHSAPLLPIYAVVPSPAAVLSPAQDTPATAAAASPSSTQTSQDQTQVYTARLDTLAKQVEGITKSIAGFRFSGDLRLQGDSIFRSANNVTGPVQNVRGRYRARLNLDKGLNRALDVHFQLGSGRFDNPLTDDTDFGGGAVRGPILLSEAWVHYRPNPTLSFRGGKMPEVFQDYSRFLWDEDLRFNGFHESIGTSTEGSPIGITRIDFRAGQYILTNPNIQVLPSAQQCTPTPQVITSLPATITPPATVPAACAYLQAGYKPGENVRAADMFDQGLFVEGRIKPGWSHYVYSNFIAVRNPNQIALASTASGLPLLVNGLPGVTLAGPLPGTGTATTIPGGGIYTASHFQIGHLAYRITKEDWSFHNEKFPVFVDLHLSRNFGASFQRDAWMATVNAGAIKKAGDVRFLYFYAVKEANSMISQFTDDHAGTLSGVNIRTHSIRFDVGLAPFLQLQNILYIQNEISPNDPARHFYVPLPRGTPTQYRAESCIFVNF